MFDVLTVLVFGVILGAILTLYLQWKLLAEYQQVLPAEQIKEIEKPKLPKEIEESLLRKKCSNDQGSMAVSLILHAVFQELKYSETLRGWLIKKISDELRNSLSKSTLGKLCKEIRIDDIDVGTCVPSISDVIVHCADLDPSFTYLNLLDVRMNIEYTGGFSVAIKEHLIGDSMAYVAITVRKVSGTIALQFRRKPFTHWSVVFVNDPQMDIGVVSNVQGRQIQRINKIIVAQLKRVVRKRQTLPYFKLRFKPFFPTPREELTKHSDMETLRGQLSISTIEFNRLYVKEEGNIYCLIGLDNTNWVQLCYINPPENWVKLVTTVNTVQHDVRFVTKFIPSRYQVNVVIEKVPIEWTDVCKGDVLVAVSTIPVHSVENAYKLLKISPAPVTIIIERISVKKCYKYSNKEENTSEKHHSGAALNRNAPHLLKYQTTTASNLITSDEGKASVEEEHKQCHATKPLPASEI